MRTGTGLSRTSFSAALPMIGALDTVAAMGAHHHEVRFQLRDCVDDLARDVLLARRLCAAGHFRNASSTSKHQDLAPMVQAIRQWLHGECRV